MVKDVAKKLICCVSSMAVALALFVGSVKPVHATETGYGQAVLGITGYSVTKEKIVPGESFTLTIDIKNYSKTTEATSVIVDMYNPVGVAPVYGTSPSFYVERIGAGETKTLEIEYDSFTSIYSDTLDFGVNAAYGIKSFYTTLRIPVGTDSPFSIVASYLPEQLSAWQTANASLTFKVLGDTNISNVAFILREDGTDFVNSVLGVMTAGSSKTHSIAFALGTTGIHNIDMILQYTDEDGQLQEMTVMSTQMNVVEYVDSGNTESSSAATSDVQEDDNSSMILLGAGGILILLICLMIVIASRKRK